MSSPLTKLAFLLALTGGVMAQTAELNIPKGLIAGNAFAISTSGTGQGTFYLVGPSHVKKAAVQLGQEISVTADDIKASGRYVAIACASGGCSSSSFYVAPGPTTKVSFLLHPSRVPVSAKDAINATAFVFDNNYNIALSSSSVEFRVVPKTGPEFSRFVKPVEGVAWMSMGSTPKEGPVKVIARVAGTAEPRIIQQVASDACNLRIKASRGKYGVVVETDPVRDCSGNTLPDGSVVSFAVVDEKGRSTVDAPIKKGVARTELPVSGKASISVASGVVMGNEITWAGGGS
jgi:hypothetical protein